MLVIPEGDIPLRLRRFIDSPVPRGRALTILTRPFSDVTLFAVQLAWEIRRPAHLGRNYVDSEISSEKLCRRYPLWRKCFVPDGLTDVWMKMPARRKVPRVRLRQLLDWVQLGRGGTEGYDRFDATEEDPDEAGYSNEEDVGDNWHRKERKPAGDLPSELPLLPEFERLWDYVERCPRLPALLIIDPIDSLAARYGVEESRLIDAIQKDLVDTGYANVIFTYTRPDRPSWLTSMDGVLSWTPIRSASRLPHWLLTIEYLIGQVDRPRRHVMRFEGGRLVSCPSDDEIVEMLLRGAWQPRARAVPSEIMEVLMGPSAAEPGPED